MQLSAFEAVMDAMNRHQAKCLLVGGMAVVAHGYGRMTYDLDLVLQLERDNILRAFQALEGLGYKPRVPVTAKGFADQQLRESWIREKGMMVLNLYSDTFPTTTVDIFVKEPFDFEAAWSKAIQAEVDGITFRYVDLDTLISMKVKAGRAVDLEDVRRLRMLADEQSR